MRRSRLATGFHRLGLILAVPTAICGAGLLIAAAFSNTPGVPALFGSFIIVGALLLYAASWAIGWAARGFMGEASASPAPVSLGAAAVPLALPVVTPAKRTERPPLVGIRGWLILPAVGTVIAPFTVAVQMVNLFDVISKAADRSHPIFAFLYGEIACNCALLALEAWAVILLFQKSRQYPRAFIAVLIAGAITVTTDALMARWLFNVPIDEEAVKSMARAIVSAAVWVPYMLRSRRVRNTFVA